ncbi:DNA repair protein RecO [Candidatus Parcubacteria bacterium]|nr:DNA repair protein RecO [Candidatus Parcubacteria bacterium]
MRNYNVEGVILRSWDYSEADRVLSVLTKNRGKISVIAKGVRKPTSKRSGSLQLLNHITLSLAEGKNWDVITEVESLSTFDKIGASLEKVGLGYLVAEVTDKFLQEGQGNYRVFRLVLMTLGRLDQRKMREAGLAMNFFKSQFLSELGFRPRLVTCVSCGVPTASYPMILFSATEGGAVCPTCRSRESSEGKEMTKVVLKTLIELENKPWQDARRLRRGAAAIQEAGETLDYYMEWLLDRRIRSQEFIERIDQLGNVR